MSSHSTNQGRRQNLRVPKETAVTINRLEYPLTDSTEEPATIINISKNGICFSAPTLYQPGSLLSLKIELRGWQQHLNSVSLIVDATSMAKPLTAIAEVLWSKEIPEEQRYEVGVRFKDIYEDEYKAFVMYLEQVANRDKS